jgi:hypothetical protein
MKAFRVYSFTRDDSSDDRDWVGIEAVQCPPRDLRSHRWDANTRREGSNEILDRLSNHEFSWHPPQLISVVEPQSPGKLPQNTSLGDLVEHTMAA